MKVTFVLSVVLFSLSANAQRLKESQVPEAARVALHKNFPAAAPVTWEKEKGAYEANWGGTSGEDHSVLYAPDGTFIETVEAIPVSQLPKPVAPYIKAHYKGARITEAGRVTNAQGVVTYEAEVNRKDLVFDKNGSFIKAED